MSVTNPDKVVTKQDLADFYEQIKPYLGSYPIAIANKFSKGDIYSTTEKLIGQWQDGKPLYQKTFTATVPTAVTSGVTASTDITLSTVGINNVDTVIYVEGYVDNENIDRPINTTLTNSSTDNSNALVIVIPKKTVLTIQNSTMGINGKTAYITMRYTKTTDSSTSIGDENDYSTSEKIVGTWIDSKPIYQKTIDVPVSYMTATTAGTKVTKNYAHGISGISQIISCKGNMFFASGGGMELDGVYFAVANSNTQVACFANNTNISFDTNNASTSWITKLYITLQYTKTS